MTELWTDIKILQKVLLRFVPTKVKHNRPLKVAVDGPDKCINSFLQIYFLWVSSLLYFHSEICPLVQVTYLPVKKTRRKSKNDYNIIEGGVVNFPY
jgi:hypothetical protein